MRILLRSIIAVLFLLATFQTPSRAQDDAPNREYFRPLDLPSVNVYRSASGKITSVEKSDTTTHVTISQEEGLLMPVDVQVSYSDGRQETRRIPVEAFTRGDTFTEVIESTDVEAITLDPARILPDVEPRNNTWAVDLNPNR